MKIQETQLGEVLVHMVSLSCEVAPKDYNEEVTKRLKSYRANADFKGFRKGNVPMEVIEKIYGNKALSSAVETVVMKQVREYLKEHNMTLESRPELVQYPESWNLGESGTVVLNLRMVDAPKEAPKEELSKEH